MQKRTITLVFFSTIMVFNVFGQPKSKNSINRDILDVIVMADKCLTATTENFTWKNKLIYDDFARSLIANGNKVRPWKQKADSIRKETEDLYNFINKLKIKIVQEADPNAVAIVNQKLYPEQIKTKGNVDIVAKIMIGTNNNGEGKKLKERITLFRNHLLTMVDKLDFVVIDAINKNLDTSDPKAVGGEHMSWEVQLFEHQPLIAVITILSKLQNDLRNTEYEITHYLYNRIDAGSFRFNKLEAIILPNTNYVLKGTEYKAQIFLAAIDSTQAPTILVDGKPVEVENGHGNYTVIGNGNGIKKWGGVIQLKSTDAPTIERRFSAEYTVAEAVALVSATKMNILYLGIDNPVDISIPGIAENKIYATISNGVILKSEHSYVVRPKIPGKVIISISAEIDGKYKQIGSMIFRVKEIPDPIAKVGNKKGGSIEKNDLLAQQIVVADLEFFDFDVKFIVTEFTVSVNKGGIYQDEKSHSHRLTDAQKDLIRNLNSGDRVTLTDIKAIGPDGKTRDLNGIMLKIQ
jgi:gliding motility-associated protein GldM